MKRTITLLIALALLLAIPACGEPEGKGTGPVYGDPEGTGAGPAYGETEEQDTSLDFDQTFTHYMSHVCATQDTIYFTSGQLIYFYDKASGVSSVLCGKAECKHNTSMGSSCNAYLNSSSKDLCVYNNRLYYTNGYYNTIYSMALDGTDHRKEREVDREIFSTNTGGNSTIFHRGCAYLFVRNYWVRDGVKVITNDLVAVPLDPDGEIYRIFSEEIDDYADTRSPIVILKARGDGLYILTNYAVDGPVYNFHDFQIRRYDVVTRELTTLYHDSQSPLTRTVELWIMDDGIVFSGYELQAGEDGSVERAPGVYKLDFESGELTGLFDLDRTAAFVEDLVVTHQYDSQWATPTNPWGFILAPQDVTRSGEFHVTLRNFAGEVLLEGSLPLEGCYFGNSFCGTDDTYAYFFFDGSYNDGYGNTEYMALIGMALDGSGMEVLCEEEEYYEWPSPNYITSERTMDDGTVVVMKDSKYITVTTPDGETVSITVKELLKNGWQQ